MTDSATPKSAAWPTVGREGTGKHIQEEGSFEVNVLAVAAEHRLLLGVAIDEESDNRSPGLLRSKEFEAI